MMTHRLQQFRCTSPFKPPSIVIRQKCPEKLAISEYIIIEICVEDRALAQINTSALQINFSNAH